MCPQVGSISERFATVSTAERLPLPYAISCVPGATRDERRIYRTLCMNDSDCESGRASPVPAWRRRPCYRWDTFSPAASQSIDASACAATGSTTWHNASHTRNTCTSSTGGAEAHDCMMTPPVSVPSSLSMHLLPLPQPPPLRLPIPSSCYVRRK